MQIQMTARHTQLTPDVKEWVERKLGKLERFLHKPAEVHLVLSLEKHRYVAEVALATGAANLRGKAENHDLYVSVDQAVDKLERQLRENTAKIRGARGNRRAG